MLGGDTNEFETLRGPDPTSQNTNKLPDVERNEPDTPGELETTSQTGDTCTARWGNALISDIGRGDITRHIVIN